MLVEPGGAIHTENCTYEAENERRVRVTGTEWVTAEQYTLKLEGVKYLGYRRVVIGGVGDPLILRQLNRWLDRCVENTRTKIEKTMGIPREDYMVRYIVYGNPENDCGG